MASIITATAHGLVADDPFKFANILPTDSGVDEGATYYVKTVLDPDTFTYTDTVGGTALTLDNAITSGDIIGIEVYSVVADGTMDPPTSVPTPDPPTLDSALVSQVVRLIVTVAALAPEAKVRAWEVQYTHEYSSGTPVWTEPNVVVLTDNQLVASIPAYGETLYAVRVRATDVFGNVSAFSTVVEATTTEGSDSIGIIDSAITSPKLHPDAVIAKVQNEGATVLINEDGLTVQGGYLNFPFPGGENVVPNSGFELGDFTASSSHEWTIATDWSASHVRAVTNITEGTELTMTASAY